MAKRTGLYLRVSTDQQTTLNQRLELEAVAGRSGWDVIGVYEDAGISGSKGRDKRPRTRSVASGCHRPQGQHDRSMVRRPAGPQLAGPGWATVRSSGRRLRPLSSSASARYQHSIGASDVSDVRRLCRGHARDECMYAGSTD